MYLVPAAAAISGLLLPLSGLAAGSEPDVVAPLGALVWDARSCGSQGASPPR